MPATEAKFECVLYVRHYSGPNIRNISFITHSSYMKKVLQAD